MTADGARSGVGPTSVVGRPRATWWQWLLLLLVPAAYLIAESLRPRWDWSSLVLPIGLAAFYAVRFGSPSVVVDAAGIRRPWRPSGNLRWSEVSAVLAPEPGVSGVVRIRTTAGEVLALSRVPAGCSAEVAALGGVPLESRPAPVPHPHAPVPTDVALADDARRRAAALRAGWRILADQPGGLPPGGRTS